jgi:putative acyl-CoA dehydrogenase
MLAAEALECLGGNGYVEDFPLAALYREAPLNSIWEGSGNVNALDVLRAMQREPECVAAYDAEIALAAGADSRLDAAAGKLRSALASIGDNQSEARRLVEQMAIVLQGALLTRFGHPAVTDAFAATRLGGDWGHAFGTLPRGVDVRAIVDRAKPKLG